MTSIKVLFLGGTGVISSACARLAVDHGIDLSVITRGQTRARPLPAAARVLHGDARDPDQVRELLGHREFDAVVDWIAFTPEHVQADIDTFRGRAGQYVFISSASAYQTPPARLPIVELTPLRNPFLGYLRTRSLSRTCWSRPTERRASRPRSCVPRTPTTRPWSRWTGAGRRSAGCAREASHRARRRDALWTLTHHRDFAQGFVPLLGHSRTIGDSFHITSDDVLTWDQIAGPWRPRWARPPTSSRAVGRIASADPQWGASLLGDKAHSLVFDNSKLRSVVPGYRAVIPFEQGAREIVDWYDADPDRQQVDARLDALMDKLVQAYGG